MAATTEEWEGLGVMVEMKWTCCVCSTVAFGFARTPPDDRFVDEEDITPLEIAEMKGDYSSLFDVPCQCDDHSKNLDTWLRKIPSSGAERIFFSQLLHVRIHMLENKQDRNEIKSMLLDFVQETEDDENSFSDILERLVEMKHNQERMFVCLAAWKRLAEGVANEQAIAPPSFTTMREIHTYIAEHKDRWKQFLNSVLASGSVHLVARLVGPFLGWGSNGVA
jgi:predicted CopG family antitoxin